MKTVYLDHAATTFMPERVLEAMVAFERGGRANAHRGLYPLASRATEAYESARQTVASFVHAEAKDLVFTKSTTEGLNLVARGVAERLGPGDEVLVTIADHHASVLPWIVAAKERGFTVRTLGLDDAYRLRMEDVRHTLSPRTRVIAMPLVSNVLGTVFPVAEVSQLAHEVGAIVVVDGAQAVGHITVDVRELGCDALAFSAHKMYGPMGIGALYLGEQLQNLSPLLVGGGMVEDASTLVWKSGPERFEGGTPNVTGAIGFAEAARLLMDEGIDARVRRECELTKYFLERLSADSGVEIIGPRTVDERLGIVSFVQDGIHAHDLAHVLGEQGICVRAGHHCVEPLARRYCGSGSVRVSFGRETTMEELEAFFMALEVARMTLSYV
ncbi:MAG: Cysteine desulfurase [Candidatus Uhrbacteria bacterium GW2011_GWD2_52_7]|uniref:cysteine desulfurase n=1 Tax=Candidatus Uhrbacteria bacterium GW2011_GWD2_52_7 TaxID=1618989 RepID=A0A0G1XFB5_9BACT|nr:MAG: Cysteine desulfurase [Candidatus Uhrbacteria bacterium GW2011_GWD2_52_7]